MVKLQIVNFAIKLFLTNPEQTTLLCQYILNLAKYDKNYDLRDRARLFRHIVFPGDAENSRIRKQAANFFLSSKPAPVLESKFKGRFMYVYCIGIYHFGQKKMVWTAFYLLLEILCFFWISLRKGLFLNTIQVFSQHRKGWTFKNASLGPVLSRLLTELSPWTRPNDKEQRLG